MQLARTASIEINVQDERFLDGSRPFLPAGARVYVSHLPGQRWDATVRACKSIRRAGFEPVAHVPVRLLTSHAELESLLEDLRVAAGAAEILLISGDYPQSAGPYHAASQILATGVLERHGFTKVSVAAHPEGHPTVSLQEIRDSERDKVRVGVEHGLDVTLVTQFLFESGPFLRWANAHRTHGLRARRVCGLAGPAKVSTLLRYAMRCGVGNSIRALQSHHASLRALMGDNAPDHMVRELAEARVEKSSAVDGIHLFCFGGYLRTVQWLRKVADGQFAVRPTGGLDLS
jgi:methylenetetrahydrofolate reductase (NADPH)